VIANQTFHVHLLFRNDFMISCEFRLPSMALTAGYT